MDFDEIKAKVRAVYGENKQITDGDYDKSLAVKCINGTFVGKKTDNVIAYKGIPFVGEQPVGEFRWKAPVDVVADDGVYEAYYNAKASSQVESIVERGSLFYRGEDCLYLNVWKADDTVLAADAKTAHPETTFALAHPCSSKKPVMVYIHGGGFVNGGTADPMFDCHNLVKENPDVVVVTVAYRLGIFGFFHISHLPDGSEYPDTQNLGTMDQMMALKWVHENIAGFGGDPDNVTIFGESAGAASVTLLPLIEGSHRYIKRLIAESGSPALTRSTDEAIQCTNEIMNALGCKTVAELQKVDVEQLLQASGALGLRIAPERDGNYLPKDMYEAYANGTVKDVEMLLGCNKDEANWLVYFSGVDGFKMWAADRKAWKIPGLPEQEKERIESFCADVKGEDYEGDRRLYDQLWFKAPLIRLAEDQTKGGGKAYIYYFTPESSLPNMKCGHETELASVFNHPEETFFTGRAFDETFGKNMRKMWFQFAKTGNPTLSADISPDGKPHEWPLYDLEEKQVMVLDEFDIHSAKESEVKLVDWDRIYPLTRYYWL